MDEAEAQKRAIAICTNPDCRWGLDAKNEGTLTYWDWDVDPDEENYFGMDPWHVPNFCPRCRSVIAKGCHACEHPIRLEEIDFVGCPRCGVELRPKEPVARKAVSAGSAK